LRQINLNEVPAGAKGAMGSIGDKEQAVGGGGDGSVERGAGSGNCWSDGVVGGTDRNGSSSRNRGNR
jgi:hypothetical protein